MDERAGAVAGDGMGRTRWDEHQSRTGAACLDVEDVDWQPDGLVVDIRRSKTDQEGKGASIGLLYGSDPATCPVRTRRAWLDATGIDEGRSFGTSTGTAGCSRPHFGPGRRCAADRHRGHSLRAGLITSAMEGGAQEHRTMQHSRHKSVHVFRTYVRDLNLLDGTNPLAAVGF
jgi:hypothetical protein